MDIYKQKYKEVLKRAKKLAIDGYLDAIAIDDIFTELKESDDERIRKKLICFVENWEKYNPNSPFDDYALYTSDRDECDKILTWLEKQKSVDEEELKKGALKYVARQFMNWLDASIPEDEMCLSNAECKIIEDAFLKDDWARISHYMCEKLKRQGEQIELKKVEQGNHPRIVMADFNGGEGFFKLNLDNLNKEQVDAIEMMINNPKQGKQTQLNYEHADIPKKDFAPIGPKFKVGEWIIHQGTENIYQVTGCIDNQYQLKYGDNYIIQKCADVDRGARLWTIQDANDGDVLVSSEGNPFIFSGKYDDIHFGNPIAYCGVNCENKFKKSSGTHWTNKDGVYPATKEQQDLLFSKMKEAGWEWDTKNKELKKIEIASKESEDEKIRKEIIDFFELPHPQFVGKRDQEKWLAWLEKQSEKKSADEVLKIRQELYQSGYNDGYKHGQEDMAISLEKESIEVDKRIRKSNAAQLIVIKNLIEDKNTSEVNRVILRDVLDEFKQFTNSQSSQFNSGHLLDPDKVIEWIHKYWPFSWGNFLLQVDDAIDKFKKDFELC